MTTISINKKFKQKFLPINNFEVKLIKSCIKVFFSNLKAFLKKNVHTLSYFSVTFLETRVKIRQQKC